MYSSELNQTTNNSRISSSRLRFDEKMTETPKIEFGMECRIAYDLCCCCLSGGHLTNMSGPYEGTGTTESYFALINRCYNTEVIAPEEPLNRYNICVKCTQRLVDSYLFKCQVIKVQRALKGFLDEFAIKTDQNVDVKILDQTIPAYLEEDNNSAFGDDPDMDAEDSEPIGRLVKAASLKKSLVTPLKKRRKRSDERLQHCHPEIHAAMDFEKGQCRLCLKTFLGDHILRQHMNEHFPNHICEECGKGFATRRRCKAHQRCHKNDDLLKCTRCEKTFDTRNKLNNHQRDHTKGTLYKCPICKERFYTHYSRRKHLRDVHGDTRKFSCKMCDYTCLTGFVLSKHVRVNHSQRIRAHPCHLCTKEFYDRSTLKSHLLVHSNLRTYKCCECNKSFIRKTNLAQHMRHHSNIRDFVCSQCGQAFIQKTSLKWHLRKHERDDKIVQ